MLHRKFIYLFCLSISFFIIGCTRVTYHPHGLTYFTLNDSGKIEILKVLDEYAELHGFIRTRDGTEFLTEESAKIVIMANYETKKINGQRGFSYSVRNPFYPKCFSLSSHDYSKANSARAIQIATDLKSKLSDVFASEIEFYEHQWCKNAT